MRMLRKNNSRFGFKYILWAVIGVVGLIIGVIAVQIYNAQQDLINFDDHFEVTFMEPQTALIFWHTKQPDVGYIKYGSNKFNLNQRADQTSSEPAIVHAVIIEQIPVEGVYISLHSLKESKFKLKKPIQIKYDPSSNQIELEDLTQ